MASLFISFFIPGLVVALVAADQPSANSLAGPFVTANQLSKNSTSNTTLKGNSTINTVTPSSVTSNITTKIPISVTTSNSTFNFTVTKKDGASTALPTPKPGGATMVPTTKDKGKDMNTPKPAAADDSTGIIIIIVIIIIALVFAVACFFARKRGRRYSVDLTSRPDEANIPLSAVEPEMHIDTVPQNGLQTFESVETPKKESQDLETNPEAQEEQKGDADKSVAEPSADSAAPAPSSDSSVDKSKEDVDEPSPPAPVELSLDEKTDDEGAVSNKTSVESLKETNENNSNNADLIQMTDLMWSKNFQDVPLDCPV